MKNIFGKREVFSIRKFSMGAASVMIAASLLVSPQTNLHVSKAKENIEVQVNKDIKVSIIEKNGGAEVELTATKDLTDVDVNVMLNGARVASYHIASIKAGEKIQKEVTKDQLEAIKQLIASGQKTLPNTAIVERSASQTISIGGNTLRVEVKYHVEDNSVPEAKPTKSVGDSEQPKPEVKPDKPEIKPAPEVKPTPEVNPEQPKPEVKPDKPEIKPAPEVKPNPEVKPEQPKPEVKPDKPEIKPAPEVKPNPEVKPEQPKPEIKPDKPEIKPVPEVKPNPEVKPEQPKPEVKPDKPEGKPAPGEQPTKPVETPEQPKPEVKPDKPEGKPTPGEQPTKPVKTPEQPKPEVKPDKPEGTPTPGVKPEQPKPDKPEVKPTPEKLGEQPGSTSELSKPKGQEDSDKDEEVIINDPILKKLINKNLSRERADDQKITKKELEVLKELRMRDEKGENILTTASLKDTPEFKFIQTHGIKNLLGLENAVNLEKLDLNENEISDLSPIAKLNKLTKLSLIRNRISNLQPLSELTNLEYLDLYANKIVDISPLAKLTNLKHLDLHNNNDQTGDPVHPTISGGIKDISVVKNLTKLEMLSLGSNNITDITPIKNLTNIKDLVLAGNHISDYSGLEQYIADRVAKQQEGEGSVSFAGQKINYDKTVDVSGSTVSVDSSFKGINELGEKLAKVFESDEPVNLFSEVTTNVEGVSATYNPETSKFDFTFTEEFLNKNQGKVVPINLKVGVEDYAWNVKNIKLNVHLSKETVKKPTDTVELSSTDKVLYRTLLNDWSNFNKKYKNLTDKANSEHVVNKKPTSIPKPNSEADFHVSDFEKLRVFDANGEVKLGNTSVNIPVTDELISSLENASNLEEFKVLAKKDEVRKIKDFTFLKKLTELKLFYYTNQNKTKEKVDVTNLDLTSNSKLEDVRVGQGNLQNLNFINGLNLKNLDVEDNEINDISSLRNMTSLTELHLDNNKLNNDNVSDIAGLVNLKTLYLKNNKDISDINALESLKNIEALELKNMNITDLSVLKKLPNLRRLVIDGNPLDKKYMDIIKELNINTGYLGEITKEDFEWLKQYASRNTMADATLNENKQREFTFTKLPITVEVKKSQIKNGKVTIENPLKDWENSGALLDSAKDAPSGMEISEDGSNITFDVTNDEEQTYKYDINIEDYNHEFEGRPANIHGTVELKLKIVPEVKSEQPKPDEHKEEKTKKLVVDDISVINKNQPVLDKLTFTFVNKKNTNEVIEKVVDKSVVSGVELTKDEVYTVTLNDNEKYQMDEIDVVARESEEGYNVLYNAKTNEVIESIEVQRVEKEAALGDDDIDTLNQITAKVVDSTGKAIGNAPLRLFEFDGGIPNIVKQDKTGEDGTLTFKSNQLKPNKKYELRIEKRDTAFNRESVIFNTDDDGDIVSIDNKIITADSTGIIEFKEERKNDNEIKTVKSYYKVVDENGNPVENVELSVNGIRTKITTLKNARSNKDGIVELDLEKKVNGVDYIVNVSKNDQFNWEFKPDSVNLNVSENGVITYSGSEGKYSLIDYNGTKIPVFVVKRVDLNYLKTDLTNKIKEAEEELEKAPNKELNDIVNSAKEELAKPETLPIYVKGYIDNLTTALNKIKESKVDKKTVKKGEIPEILVRNGREPELREITFEFVNKQDSTDKVEITSSNGSLTNIELTVGAEYIIKVKGENDQVLPGSLEIKEEDGNFVPYKVGTDEFYDSIDLSE